MNLNISAGLKTKNIQPTVVLWSDTNEGPEDDYDIISSVTQQSIPADQTEHTKNTISELINV